MNVPQCYVIWTLLSLFIHIILFVYVTADLLCKSGTLNLFLILAFVNCILLQIRLYAVIIFMTVVFIRYILQSQNFMHGWNNTTPCCGLESSCGIRKETSLFHIEGFLRNR